MIEKITTMTEENIVKEGKKEEDNILGDLPTSPSASERGLTTLRLGWRRTLLLCWGLIMFCDDEIQWIGHFFHSKTLWELIIITMTSMTFALVFCWRCRFTLSKSNFVENEREDSDYDCDEVQPLRVLPVAACLPPSQADSGLELSQERADSPCYHYLHHRQCRHNFHHHPKQILNIKNVIIEIWGLLNLYVSHKLALCWEGFKNMSKRKFLWWGRGGGTPFSR